MLEVIDNFLDIEVCKTLESKMLSNTFPWMYLPQSIPGDNLYDFFFVHTFLEFIDNLHKRMLEESGEEDRDYMVSTCFNIIEPIVKGIVEHFNFDKEAILRVKANLDTVQNEHMVHATHTDLPLKTLGGEPYLTLVYHVNNNNGATVVNDEKIEQKENRLIVFDGSFEHYGITQTDIAARLVVNFDFRRESL